MHDSVEELIMSWNDLVSEEIALPGNWSGRVFLDDLNAFPPTSKELLLKTICDSLKKPITYREFFEITRGMERKVEWLELWEIFDSKSQHSLMLYFEDFFYTHHSTPHHLLKLNKEERAILSGIREIHSSGLECFMRKIGCFDIQWFLKEPLLYITEEGTPLLKEQRRDEVLLAKCQYYTPSSRSDLVKETH